MRKFALVLLLPLLAGCVENDMPMETDISKADMNDVCPVDVSEADRASYPACN